MVEDQKASVEHNLYPLPSSLEDIQGSSSPIETDNNRLSSDLPQSKTTVKTHLDRTQNSAILRERLSKSVSIRGGGNSGIRYRTRGLRCDNEDEEEDLSLIHI